MTRSALPRHWTRHAAVLAAWALCGTAWATGTAAPSSDSAAQARRWIAEMKTSPRGPFSGIQWFCRDGRVLPPKDFSCAGKDQAGRDKGWQHGAYSDRTRQLRAQGLQVATLLAGIDPDKAMADEAFPDHLAQWLVEKYLVAADDGWILRKAQFYRGAVQEEDERDGEAAVRATPQPRRDSVEISAEARELAALDARKLRFEVNRVALPLGVEGTFGLVRHPGASLAVDCDVSVPEQVSGMAAQVDEFLHADTTSLPDPQAMGYGALNALFG